MDELVLKVFFEDPFWVGVFERYTAAGLQVSKVTFGAEPKDAEIYEYILREFYRLRFSPAVSCTAKADHTNPKRRQREVKQAVESVGMGTKSQQALQAQRELAKTERRQRTRAERDAEAARRFAQKQQKKKEKHRGH